MTKIINKKRTVIFDNKFFSWNKYPNKLYSEYLYIDKKEI